MHGSLIAYMVTVVLAFAWVTFLIVAILAGSLVRIGIAVAVAVAAYAVLVYRRKKLKDEMDELDRRK